MKCGWCGQQQPEGQKGRCQLCAQELGTRFAADTAAGPVEESSGSTQALPPTRRKRKWPLVLLLLLIAGAAYYFLDLPIPGMGADEDDTPSVAATEPGSASTEPTEANVFHFPDLPEGATDCHNGVAVSGDLSCEFGAAVSHGLRAAGGAAAADGDTITVPAVEDPVREMTVDVVCTIGSPSVCALGADEKVYINR